MIDKSKLEQIANMNTVLFVDNTIQAFDTMAGIRFEPESVKPLYSPVSHPNGFVAIMHFIGKVQGDYIIYTDEITASKIADVYPEDGNLEAVCTVRNIFADLLCEVLNVSSNDSLFGLESRFGRLVLNPPVWVFGEYHVGHSTVGVCPIKGECGIVQCSCYINSTGVENE